MIIKDIISKQLELFDEYKWSFYNFYKGYDLAVIYLKYEKNIKINPERKEFRNKLLAHYYFESLNEALETTEKKKEESEAQFHSRVKSKYNNLRRRSFELLQRFYIEDYKQISNFFSSPKIVKKEIEKMALNNKIWMVQNG